MAIAGGLLDGSSHSTFNRDFPLWLVFSSIMTSRFCKSADNKIVTYDKT